MGFLRVVITLWAPNAPLGWVMTRANTLRVVLICIPTFALVTISYIYLLVMINIKTTFAFDLNRTVAC